MWPLTMCAADGLSPRNELPRQLDKRGMQRRDTCVAPLHASCFGSCEIERWNYHAAVGKRQLFMDMLLLSDKHEAASS